MVIAKSIYFIALLQSNNKCGCKGCFIVSEKKAKRNATETDKRIGGKIKELRKEAGLSQEAFGSKYHLSQNDVTNIENGYKTASFDLLLDIAKDYDGVTTDYLIKENGVRGNNPDLQYICDYTGLDEDTINSIINAPLLSTLPTNPDDLAIILKSKRIDNRTNVHSVLNSILSNADFHNVISIMLIIQEKNNLLNEELSYIEQHKDNYNLDNNDYLLYDKLDLLTPDNEEDLKRASKILNNQINVMKSYNECLSLINEIKAYNYDIRNSFEKLFAFIDELPNDRLLDIQSMYLAISNDYNRTKEDYDINITFKNGE